MRNLAQVTIPTGGNLIIVCRNWRTEGYGMECKVSAESYQCRNVIPSEQGRSSRDVGWSSLLVDIHSGVASHETYSSIHTNDFRVGVTLQGRFACDHYSKGRWRIDEYATGAIMLHHTEDQTAYRFPRPDKHFQLALMYLPIGLMENAMNHFRRPGQSSKIPTFNSAIARDAAIATVTQALIDIMMRQASDLHAETTAAWMASHISHRYGLAMSPEDERSPGVITDSRIARVLEYMSEHYADPITLDRLAAEACVSKFHFNRLFKQKVGATPLRALADIRLKAARRLLLSSDATVSEIARRCGFQSASHFSSVFFERYGAVPTQVQRASQA